MTRERREKMLRLLPKLDALASDPSKNREEAASARELAEKWRAELNFTRIFVEGHPSFPGSFKRPRKKPATQCSKAGCTEPATVEGRCGPHHAEHVESTASADCKNTAAWRARRRAVGRCVVCGAPAKVKPDGTFARLCVACSNEKNLERKLKRRGLWVPKKNQVLDLSPTTIRRSKRKPGLA